MKRPPKSKKALSLLAATIILVAIVITASLVAFAWFQGTFTSIETEQIVLSDVTWDPDNANVSLTFENTGTTDLSIKEIKIAGARIANINPPLDTPYLLQKGVSATFLITAIGGFNHKVHYMIMLTTNKGKSFGPYYKTAP